MKKLSLLFVMLLACFSGIKAQENNTNVRHLVAENVPLEVLASIKSGHPGLNMDQYLKALKPVKRNMKRVIKMASKPPHPYIAVYKGKDYRKKEIYTKEGKLLYARERIKDTMLPRAVYKRIGKDYNTWGMEKNMAIIVTDWSGATPVKVTYYKVLLQDPDGKEKKRLKLDENGNDY